MSFTDDDAPAISYKLLARGTPVVSSDGDEVGTVDQVLDNVKENIFDGIVVRRGSGTCFVDAPEVARITERRVTLTIDAAEAEGLPEHRGWRGAMETQARRSANRWKRRLGR